MYRSSYAEVLEHAPHNVREAERDLVLRSISLLEKAEQAGAGSREGVEALYFMQKLWEFLLSGLADQENGLPEKLRADLISVGIGVLKEIEAIRRGESQSFQSLKEISQIIADGLS
jgi:flagellar biosynthesis activator protein FlaF